MIDTLLQVRSNRNNSGCFNLGTGFKTILLDGKTVINNATIREIKKTQNGSLIIGFSSVNIYDGKPINPVVVNTGAASPAVIKLKTTGEIDNSFYNYGFTSLSGTSDQSVTSIEETTDGKYIIGGNFNSYSGISYNNIIKLNSNGTIDNTFNIGTGFNDIVSDIELQSDGKIIVTGQFTSYSGVSKNRIVRLNSNGTIDNTFNIGTGFSSGTVYDSKIQSDGKIICVGTFPSYNGSTAGRIIRLNTDGTIDTTFNSGQVGFNNGSIMTSVELQSDGKIVVGGGGNITSYNGISYTNKILFRLNTNGSIDSSFMSNVPNKGIDGLGPAITNIAIQSNGKILSYSSQNILSRLNSDGTLDIIVNNNNNSTAGIYFTESLLIDGDKLYVPLNFLNGEKSTGIFRLNLSDLSSDTCVLENEIYLDLYEDISVKVNMSFSEIQDITSKNSGFSQSFKVPGTRENNKFFNYMFDVNADNLTFNMQQSVPCTLSYKGETVMDGTLRLLKIYVNKNSVDYEVNVQDEVGLLINDISNKSLYDLDFTDLNHTYNSTSVTSSWNATYTGGTSSGGLKDGKILYGFSHNGYIYDKSGTTITTGSNASPLLELSGLPGTISYSGTPMRTTGFKPSMQIYDLTRRIFEQNGYTLESDFFATQYFQRLYLPLMFVSDQYYISSSGATDGTSQIVLSEVRNPIGFDFSGGTCGGSSFQYISVWCPLNQLVSNNGPIYPSSGWNTGSGTFNAWSGGIYKFDFKARISIPYGADGAQGEIYLCKNLDNTTKYGVISYALEGSFNNQEDIQNTDVTITLAPGDTINLVMDFYIAGAGCITGYPLIQPEFQLTETSVIVTDAPNLIVGSTVDVKEQFTPEYKQLDFLKGLMTQFNLVFIKHPFKTKTYIMEPFEDYVGQGKLLDWTSLLDTSKDITVSPITNINGKAINFLYQEEADAMNTFTKSINNNRIFGTYNFIPQDTKINDQPINITSFFSPTPCDTLPFADILPQPFIVPHLYGAKESTKEGVTNTQLLPMRLKPRILHYYGLQPLSSTWYYLNDASGNTETKTSYPLIHHQNRIPSISDLGTAIDLNFGNSASPQDNVVPTTTTNTGYALYYEDYIGDLLDTNARMVTAYFNLNVTDITNLEYKDLIFVKDSYYRINKIENFSLIESTVTKVELVKLLRVDINYDCTIDATVELISGTPSGSCCLNPFVITGDYNYMRCSNTPLTINPTISGTTGTIYYTWDTPTVLVGSVSGATANYTPVTAPFTISGITNTGQPMAILQYNITGRTSDGFCTDVQYVELDIPPTPVLTSSTTPTGISGGTTFNYTITTNLTGGTGTLSYSWSRPAFGDNVAFSGTGITISEVLVNTGATTQYATYTVILNNTQTTGAGFQPSGLTCSSTYTVTVPVYSSTTPPPTGSTYNYYLVYRVEYPYSVKWTLSSNVGSDDPGDWVTVPFDIGTSSNQDIRYYVQYNVEPTQLVSCYLEQMLSTNTCTYPSVIPSDYIVNINSITIDDASFVNTGGSIWQKIDGGDTYNIIIVPAY